MATTSGYLQINSITKTFGDVWAVDDVNLSIEKGELFALLGGSGCGKSTLLRMLAGFEVPTAGQIILDGQCLNEVPPYKRPVNMMFQSYALFPHMSVEKNLAYGLKRSGMPKAEIAERVVEMLELVRMKGYARRKPDQLSGGQQQRVALARSLAKNPKLLLLDEPMGALDKKLRVEMQLEVVDILEAQGVTCVMVTHDQEEAMTMASRIAVMDDGKIRQVGTPDEIYEQPTSRFTAEFIGTVNLIDGVVISDQPDKTDIQSDTLDGVIHVGHGISGFEEQAVAFAIRPEKIFLSKVQPDVPNRFQGKVIDIAYLGSHSIYHVQVASGAVLKVQMANDARWAGEAFTWEDDVWLYWSETAGVVIPE